MPWAQVLVVLPKQASKILTRELIYTGVTRAKDEVSVLCDRKVLEEAVGETVKRASGLCGQVWNTDHELKPEALSNV